MFDSRLVGAWRLSRTGEVLSFRREVDLRAAVNAISDVVQNRPRPIRAFDQIYMKAGDMVVQSEIVADWADGKRLAFIGDGDAISVCVAYLKQRGIIDFGPSRVTVFDFDERIVSAIKRFADKERLEWLDAVLYNCLDHDGMDYLHPVGERLKAAKLVLSSPRRSPLRRTS